MTDRNPQKYNLEELCILLHFQAVTLTEMDRVLQTHFRAEKTKMPVPAFQFQQLCQIPAMSVENTISTQKDPAAICKLSLILKKRLRRLIALSCLILLCPAESQHSREWQLYETPDAVLVKKPALSLIMQLNNNNN